MSQALRKLTAVTAKQNVCIVFINQLRFKQGIVFGNPETTTGGNALKFYASLRLDIRKIGQVKEGEQAVGSRVRVKVVKNKCAPPFREAEFEVRFGTGIDRGAELLDLAVVNGIVTLNEGCYFEAGQHRGTRERAKLWAKDNQHLLDVIKGKVVVAE